MLRRACSTLRQRAASMSSPVIMEAVHRWMNSLSMAEPTICVRICVRGIGTEWGRGARKGLVGQQAEWGHAASNRQVENASGANDLRQELQGLWRVGHGCTRVARGW